MRSLTFALGVGALALAVLTARWYSEAHRVAGRNERLEREIAQISRERDMHRSAVERLRQPLAIRLRVQDLARNGGRPRGQTIPVKGIGGGKLASGVKTTPKAASLSSPKSSAKKQGTGKTAPRAASSNVKVIPSASRVDA